ncbi:MAG: GNAT family N-acetyltransferase [Verrucomicrobiota bacterium]|jgi:ribosomal protein S18 acetylase RimI-like enzyme
MIVRTAKATDAPKIAHIHVETWRTAYRGQIPDTVLDALDVERRTAFWRERLTQARGSVFVAEDDNIVVGFCDLIPSRDKNADARAVAEIAAIYILPQHWRKGAGRALCDSALAAARGQNYKVVTLWVLASNGGARCFYEAMGFSLDGATKTDKTTDGSDLHEVRFRITI